MHKHRSNTSIRGAIDAAAQRLDPLFNRAKDDVAGIIGNALTSRQYYTALAVIDALRDDVIERITPPVTT